MRYIVRFYGEWNRYGTTESEEINGYYAKKQPRYEWSFTDNILEAKIWKTQKGAENQIQHQRECSYRDLNAQLFVIDENYHIINEIEVNKVKIIVNDIYKNQEIDEDFWT